MLLSDGRQSGDGLRFVQDNLLMLNSSQLGQCFLGRESVLCLAQFRAHDPLGPVS